MDGAGHVRDDVAADPAVSIESPGAGTITEKIL